MKKIICLVFFTLLICTNAFAKWKYKVGDIVQNEVVFGKKDSFKLPPGEFVVGINYKKKEFKHISLYQTDKESGYLRWMIHLYATGNTQWGWWNPPKFCKRTNVYFIKKFTGNKKFSCWMVNHTRSDISANDGFWAKAREYEIANKLKSPDILVYSHHEFSKGSKLWGSEYYYNPELDGVPKPISKEWDTNEFHKQRVMDHPKHEEFLNKYISVSSRFIDEFNKTHKIKNSSKLSLNVEDQFTQVSINVGSDEIIKKEQTGDIVKQIKELKELMDAGALSKEEFEKAKKKLLN